MPCLLWFMLDFPSLTFFFSPPLRAAHEEPVSLSLSEASLHLFLYLQICSLFVYDLEKH